MNELKGIMTPVVTPFTGDGRIDTVAYVEHCQRSLAQGTHYVTPFGTTGEALSLGLAERCATLETVIAEGVDPSVLLPGTGFNSLTETVEATRHALAHGVAAVMILPPFFYKDASDAGLFAWFAKLIERVADERLRICLYHIPQNTGIGFSPALVGKLAETFPDTITAIKDSSGDWENTKAYIAAAPGISVFPGSEAHMPDRLKAGAAGCISATCNVNATMIRALFEAGVSAEGTALEAEVNRVRGIMQGAGLIPAIKWLLEDATGRESLGRVRPPLLPMDAARGNALKAELGRDLDELYPLQS